MEHVDLISSLESGLSFDYISSIRILNILEVIAKIRFSKIAKFSTLIQLTMNLCSLLHMRHREVNLLMMMAHHRENISELGNYLLWTIYRTNELSTHEMPVSFILKGSSTKVLIDVI